MVPFSLGKLHVDPPRASHGGTHLECATKRAFKNGHHCTARAALPGERLEGRETPEKAICRELIEEVGGKLRPLRLLLAFREPELPALRLVYQCVLEFPPTLPSVEVTAWGFFALEDLPLSLRPLQQMAIATARSQAPRAVPRL